MKLKPIPAQALHGANLHEAIARFGGCVSDWLDLSSAVSPYSWLDECGTELPLASAHHLPAADDAFAAAQRAYYGRTGLALAGSQEAIRLLPGCFAPADVWVLKGTYGEHALRWSMAGHQVQELSETAIRARISAGDQPGCVVLVNPGNPGGERFAPAEILHWAEHMAGGWLVVDETFIDLTPQQSLLAALDELPSNLIVLRSPGKFFGLAGLRAGFVFASQAVTAALAAHAGPWTLSGPAQHWVTQALNDRDWQQAQRERLATARQRMQALFSGWPVVAATDLFFTLESPDAARWHNALAGQKIWTRLFAQQQRLRLGLPATEADVRRLGQVLEALHNSNPLNGAGRE
ncbi:threonine-phosphate decarboxylase [Thalassolituus sp. LLYu03]|uniref:threonine-phosphate decarboxylase n=1 Tax=Thalassolituus sp. LLYu03 TaxID=3421656 RepID=UPI003D2BB91D